MIDILTIIPGKKSLTSSGWYSFNAICCLHRGHRADTRKRGGIKMVDNGWSFHCFNCGFKAGFFLGKSLTKNTRTLLSWCGVDEAQINRYNVESLQQKDLFAYSKKVKEKKKIKFTEKQLPDGELIDSKNVRHKIYIDYLTKRGIKYDSYPFLVTPDDIGRNSKRIIVPFTYENKIVGCTSRFLDDRAPRYINEQQPGYVFGYDFIKPEQQFVILCEGIFDALSIDACALTHNNISNEQAQILSQTNKRIIFVPDMDITGLKTCDRAIELGYDVSIPEWDNDVKDINDAVVRYGKLPTLLSIIQHATTSKVHIELRRLHVRKRFK